MNKQQARIRRLKARVIEAERREQSARGALDVSEHLLSLTKRERKEAEKQVLRLEIACAVAIAVCILTMAWGLCK
jgi:hypothetical protein